MKIKQKNNEGFTLVELVVVIAIISVLTGVTVLGINFLTNSRVKKAYNVILSSYSEARINSMSKTVATPLKITFSDKKYYVEIGNEGKEEILTSPYIITYTTSDGNTCSINDSNPELIISFYRSTGGVKPLSGTKYVVNINVANKEFEIVPDTGKYKEK